MSGLEMKWCGLEWAQDHHDGPWTCGVGVFTLIVWPGGSWSVAVSGGVCHLSAGSAESNRLSTVRRGMESAVAWLRSSVAEAYAILSAEDQK